MATVTPPARMVGRFFEILESIDGTLGRLLAVHQASRKTLDVIGTTSGGGTVGQQPATCTVQAPAGNSPGTILDRNPRRRGLSVQNLSASGGPNLTVGLGVTQPQAGSGIVLAPGAAWDGRLSGEVWVGTVVLVASAAGCAFSFIESTGPSARLPNEVM